MEAKAYLENTKTKAKVAFLFNPNELTIEKANQFAEVSIPGLPSSTFQFVKGGARTLNLNLFFDTYEKRIVAQEGEPGTVESKKSKVFEAGTDVRTFTDQITGWDSGRVNKATPSRGLMDINADLHAPPICNFVWGSFRFPCIIEKVSKKFTMFLPTGVPVRATLNVTLREYRDIKNQLAENPLASTDRTKIWKVKQGDTLWIIAEKEYGDPALWRPIAKSNKIYNPRVLKPGLSLIIPPLEQQS